MWNYIVIILIFLTNSVKTTSFRESILSDICNSDFKGCLCSKSNPHIETYKITCLENSTETNIIVNMDEINRLKIDCFSKNTDYYKIDLRKFLKFYNNNINSSDSSDYYLYSMYKTYTLWITNCRLTSDSAKIDWQTHNVGSKIEFLILHNVSYNDLEIFKGAPVKRIRLFYFDLNGSLNILNSMPKLEIINLDGNNLTSLDGLNLKFLKDLWSANNKIKNVTRETLLNISSIRTFHVTGTEIECLASDTFQNRFFERFELGSDRLNSIGRDLFQYSTNNPKTYYESLELVNYKKSLGSLPNGIFNGTRYVILKISLGLVNLNRTIFGKMEMLRELWLNGNNLTYLPINFDEDLPRLRYLNLSQNYIQALPSFFAKGLNTLDLSFNNLKVWRR